MRPFYTITEADVAKRIIRAFNRVWLVDNFMGHIRPDDVGKRVYLVDGVLQVENDEQRDRRMSR